MPRPNGLQTKWEKENRRPTPLEIAEEVMDVARPDLNPKTTDWTWSLYCHYFDKLPPSLKIPGNQDMESFSALRAHRDLNR